MIPLEEKFSNKDYKPFIDVKMKYFSRPQPVDTFLSQRCNSLKPLFHHLSPKELQTSFKISSRQTTKQDMHDEMMSVLNVTECPDKICVYFLQVRQNKSECEVLAMILFYCMPKNNNIFSQNVNNIFKLKFHAFVGISFFVRRIIKVAHHLYSKFCFWQYNFLMTGN